MIIIKVTIKFVLDKTFMFNELVHPSIDILKVKMLPFVVRYIFATARNDIHLIEG